MNESVKAILGAIIVICFLLGVIAWSGAPQNDTIRVLRYGSLLIASPCLAVLIWAQNRKDKVPDFLRHIARSYFERDGLCFAVVPDFTNEPVLSVYFQNRYDRRCLARIVMQLASGPLRSTPELSQHVIEVSCDAAEYGRTVLSWPLAHMLQGQVARLNLAASVKYPDGRGTLLRYRDGMRVGAVQGDLWGGGIQVVGALAGVIVINRPAQITIAVPTFAITTSNGSPVARSETLWKLGDPVSN